MFQIWKYALQKNIQGGYASPDDFKTTINQGSRSFLDYLLGEFQQYVTGRPVPKVQFGMNESVRQSLTALIQKPVLLTVDVTGLALYPSDFEQVDAVYTTSMNRIRFASQHKLYSYLNSQIDLIPTNPIYLIIDTGFQFYPIAIESALLSYVKTPPDIVWGFNPDANGLPVYDQSLSADPIWYDADCLQVIVRALSLVGVNLQMPQLEQYCNMIKTQGQ